MSSLKDCISELREIRAKHGYGNFDQAVKALNRERIDPAREKRIKWPKGLYQKLYDAQGGICPACKRHLYVPANRGNEIDHIDPNRADFNHRTNLQLVHGVPCNRKKSSKDVFQQSKETGKGVGELLSPGFICSTEEDGVGS